MHYLIAFIYFLFALVGIDGQGSHTIATRSIVNGVDVLYSRTRVIGSVADVACINSASGRCHYRLLPGDCLTSQPPRRLPADCANDTARAFVLPAGATRVLAGLAPGVALCVSVDSPKPGSGCEPLADASALFP
ncbi:MAG: hypothetical protein WC617_05020 [Rhodanobacter sp.]|jgi:hypothetical protein